MSFEYPNDKGLQATLEIALGKLADKKARIAELEAALLDIAQTAEQMGHPDDPIMRVIVSRARFSLPKAASTGKVHQV